jgi:hypothetical protein
MSPIELDQEWYTQSDLARLKGISASWLCRHRWALPLGGAGAKMFGGHWRWHKSHVEPWLDQEDPELFKLYGTSRLK